MNLNKAYTATEIVTLAQTFQSLGNARSGYYDWKERRHLPDSRQLENIRLRERIREEFARSHQTYGSPRLAHTLGCPGRRNRIARLMRLERIFARQRSKYRPATTDSRHSGPSAPNRLHNLVVRRSNQPNARESFKGFQRCGPISINVIGRRHESARIDWR